jgi:chromosome segregation ATPase
MHGDELNRLAATISHLRDDRQTLVEKIEELERLHELDKRENLNLKSELEEKKIEISIIKKRFSQQLEEMKYSQQLLEEKKRLLEEKNSSFQKEYERLNHKVQIDIKKVQQREKELENQLDLLKVDAETQVRNRDNKILDLKRKIDSLEFDLEQLSLKENRNRDDKFEVEEKMDKLMKTLRSAITILEGDEQQLKNFDFIKKNLDI